MVGSGRFLYGTGGFRRWRNNFRYPLGSQAYDFMTHLPDGLEEGGPDGLFEVTSLRDAPTKESQQ